MCPKPLFKQLDVYLPMVQCPLSVSSLILCLMITLFHCSYVRVYRCQWFKNVHSLYIPYVTWLVLSEVPLKLSLTVFVPGMKGISFFFLEEVSMVYRKCSIITVPVFFSWNPARARKCKGPAWSWTCPIWCDRTLLRHSGGWYPKSGWAEVPLRPEHARAH